MKRKISLSAVFALMLIAVLLTFLVTNSAISAQYDEKMKELDADQLDFQKLTTIDSIVHEHYAGKIDETVQSESAISGYIAGLNDTYSRYLTAEEYAEYLLNRNQTQLYELGFSIGYNAESATARISHVESSSQAATFGLKVGDTLLSIGDKTVADDGIEAVRSLLSGENGTSTAVSVSREEEKATYTLNYTLIQKDRVSATMPLGQTALITIHSFEEGTKEDLKTAIDTMISSGADSLVFDVRALSSLRFDEAVECVDVIAGMSELARLMTHGESVEVLMGDGASVPLDCAVLTDADTCGAPELFAASLRDVANAVLIGANTAGCASVQADLRLNDMSAVILTTKIYLPPVSDSFEGVGVAPDHALESKIDFRALSPEADPVFTEAYYILKPDKRPTGEEKDPIVMPETDSEASDPTLIEPNMGTAAQ